MQMRFRFSTFPKVWKFSKTRTIFKKGKDSDFNKYRPVAIRYMKEFLIFTFIRQWFHMYSLTQHGFHSGRSTTTNLSLYLLYENLSLFMNEKYL